MSNRVNQPGRGRTAMGFHRGRALTPLGARFHIPSHPRYGHPPGWGGGRRLGASAALSVGPTTASSDRHAVRASCSATPRRAGASSAFLPTLARRSQRGPREFCQAL